MLPDWPALKREFSDAFRRHIRAKVQERSVTGAFPSTIQHEGKQSSIARADGTKEDINFVTSEGEILVKFEEIKQLRLRDMLPKLEPIIENMSRMMSEHVFSTIDQITQQTGNVIDGNGQPLSAELMIKVWDKMNIDFTKDGQPKWPILVIAPTQADNVKAQIERLHHDPKVKHIFERLVQKKREEWRAREADRVLVG